MHVDSVEEGSQTSSMVDDAFFIVKKSVRYSHFTEFTKSGDCYHTFESLLVHMYSCKQDYEFFIILILNFFFYLGILIVIVVKNPF